MRRSTWNPEKGTTHEVLCLAYGNQEKMEALSKAEFEALVTRCRQHDEELKKTGQVVLTESLEWDVTTIRPKNGKPRRLPTGRSVETKETAGDVFHTSRARATLKRRDPHRVDAPGGHLGEHLGCGRSRSGRGLGLSPVVTLSGDAADARGPRGSTEIWRAESRRSTLRLAPRACELIASSGLRSGGGKRYTRPLRCARAWPRDGRSANPWSWLVSAGRFKAVDTVRRARASTRRCVLAERIEEPMERAGRRERRRRPPAPDLHLRASVARAGGAGRVRMREVCGSRRGDRAAFLTTAPRSRSASCAPRASCATRAFRTRCRRARTSGRLDAVLRIVYLVFNEGYSASSGAALRARRPLGEAIRLGRLLVELLPSPKPEACSR
jgi:hypothetical protein